MLVCQKVYRHTNMGDMSSACVCISTRRQERLHSEDALGSKSCRMAHSLQRKEDLVLLEAHSPSKKAGDVSIAVPLSVHFRTVERRKRLVRNDLQKRWRSALVQTLTWKTQSNTCISRVKRRTSFSDVPPLLLMKVSYLTQSIILQFPI